eukprot:Em0036g32a
MSWLPELVELYDTVINLASMHKQASHLPHSIAVAMASICRSRAKGRSKAVECTLSTGGSPPSHLKSPRPSAAPHAPPAATGGDVTAVSLLAPAGHSWPTSSSPL